MGADHSDAKTISLPQAAIRLQVSWNQAYRMLLQGELRGEQRRGRWYVLESDLPGSDPEAAEGLAG